ncbi:hypothetical protein IGI04_018732 [Brassica rapa subsp. trilocularis]|uniref:Ribosomal protein S14 n=1 Tax=Brassica rapa subsp. trilocularis TaxID=1813537 RepID=A0ABQ7MDU6_BRACM|nr:hypothetical protein IGI04_018732 [Brassica rapa subsp. trilocularis]
MAISKLHERKLKANDLKYRQRFNTMAISKLHERKLKANDLKYRQRLIRKGIPPVLREKVCLSLSDAAKKSPPP